jgi:hypothetical protein
MAKEVPQFFLNFLYIKKIGAIWKVLDIIGKIAKICNFGPGLTVAYIYKWYASSCAVRLHHFLSI